VASSQVDAANARIITQMLDAWRSAPPPSSVTVEMTEEGFAAAYAFVVMHGWMARVARSAEAALLLHSRGHGVEASPLIRSMIEHAMALTWIEDKRGDAFLALQRKRSGSAQRLNDSQNAGWQLDPDAQALIDTLVTTPMVGSKAGDHLMALKHQADAYGLGGLYQAWILESGFSHPSIESARPYYVEVEEGPSFHLLYEPVDTGQEIPASVAVAVLSALIPYSRADSSGSIASQVDRWHAELQELANRLREERQQSGRGD